MKPIIKWPGGKSRELARITALLPPFETLVEPFLGGGALFFGLEPARALLNDVDPDLIGLYRAVREGDPGLRSALLALADDRVELRRRAARRAAGFAQYVGALRAGEDPGSAGALAERPGDGDLSLPAGPVLTASIASKARRLLGLERKHGRVFTPEELPAHFATALLAGHYTAVRDGRTPGDDAAARARFFYLRDLCYGSMFRYSGTGRFNIPYGGISYNRVDLRAKAARLYDPSVRDLLGRAELSTADFGEFLASVTPRLSGSTFVFLDPPYDTEFSDYGNRSFGRSDQERLARAFVSLPCPALLVVRETAFVRGLYEEAGRALRAAGRPFFLTAYGKTYGYNVRGRNDRSARHLLVGNYDPPIRELFPE